MGYNAIISIMPKGAAYDADAQAFITATGISGTNANSINTLVIDLKAANIWTKMKALYPIVGGTATAHKFNLKDPRDLDAAFRLVFFGGVSHSSNGIAGNALNGYANTFLNPLLTFPSGFSSFGIYNKVEITNPGGVYIGTSATSNIIRISAVASSIRNSNRGGGGSSQTIQPIINELGFYANSRTSNTLLTSIDNTGAFQTAIGNITIAYTNFNIPLLANNQNDTIAGYSNAQLAFAYISDALSSGELTILKAINETYQTTLNRNV